MASKSRMVCGNDPRAQLTDGDQQAVAEFGEFLANRKQLLAEIPAFAEEVQAERLRQLDKFGDQRHPDLSGNAASQCDARAMFAEWADNYRDINAGKFDPRDPDRRLDWTGILLEEVYEALAEADPAKVRTELVQCAAVIQAWISDIDRRANGGTS